MPPAMPPATWMPWMKDDYIQSFKLILPCLPCLLPPKIEPKIKSEKLKIMWLKYLNLGNICRMSLVYQFQPWHLATTSEHQHDLRDRIEQKSSLKSINNISNTHIRRRPSFLHCWFNLNDCFNLSWSFLNQTRHLFSHLLRITRARHHHFFKKILYFRVFLLKFG